MEPQLFAARIRKHIKLSMENADLQKNVAVKEYAPSDYFIESGKSNKIGFSFWSFSVLFF
jgi:hypothetical protein